MCHRTPVMFDSPNILLSSPIEVNFNTALGREPRLHIIHQRSSFSLARDRIPELLTCTRTFPFEMLGQHDREEGLFPVCCGCAKELTVRGLFLECGGMQTMVQENRMLRVVSV